MFTTMYFAMSNELIYHKMLGTRRIGWMLVPPTLVGFGKYLTNLQNDVEFKFENVLSGYGWYEDKKRWVGKLEQARLDGKPSIRNPFIIDYERLPISDSNGLVGLAHFQTTMDSVLAEIEKPIFAVIDHNSAHHISYFLARRAFSMFTGTSRRKVVINFDNHADGNMPLDPNFIHCNNWAYHFFLSHDESDPAVNPVYISIGAYKQRLFEQGVIGKGPDGKDITKKWADGETAVYYGSDRKTFITGPLKDTPIDRILGNVGGWVGIANWNEADVYITVDRDFMSGSWTNYGDGHFTSAEGRAAVNKCLEYFAGGTARLVGFDVIGLPGTRGQSYELTSELSSSGDTRTIAINKSITDIKEFYTSVSHYGAQPIPVTLHEANASRAADAHK